MIRVEATPACPRTTRILMGLEELGLAYTLEVRDPGFFVKTYNLASPYFEDGPVAMFEPNAILRYLMRSHAPSALAPGDLREWALVDQWMDFEGTQLAPAAGRIAQHRKNVPAARQDRPMMEAESHVLLRALAALDAYLGPKPFVLGRFTLADCTFTTLEILPETQIPIDHFSAVQDYAQRLLGRVAYRRARARQAAATA
jgi:glutathione S-transferase